MKAFAINNMGLEPISHFQFNATSGAWESVTDGNQIHRPTNSENLRIVAYNVLSAPHLDPWICEIHRWNHILDVTLPQADADVFLLSEVSQTFWNMARERDWVRNGYYMTDYHSNHGPRNNLIISRYPLSAVSRETKGVRRAVIARISPSASTAPLVLACTHLHAQYNGYLIRKNQLDAMYECLARDFSAEQSVLIMGDLNFHNERENVNITAPYYDVYRSLHPVEEGSDEATWTEEQRGVTFDAERNLLVYNIVGNMFPHRMRLDRALLRPAVLDTPELKAQYTHTLVPTATSIFAKEPISPTEPDLVPSDHYALQIDFTKRLNAH